MIRLLALYLLFKPMAETTQNSYLQRYQLKQQTQNSQSLAKSLPKVNSPSQAQEIQANTIGNVVGKLSERVDGIQVKLTSLVNVVKLLQKYTETRDDQYQKEKENSFNKKPNADGGCSTHCNQMQIKVREFDILTKQFKDELRNIEKLKGSFTFAASTQGHHQIDQDEIESSYLQDIEERMRTELNKKMEICIKLISNNNQQRQYKTLLEKVNEISFNVNQLQNECRRNKMMFEKQVDNLTILLKENSTQVPNNYSRVTENEVNSKSPLKAIQKSKSRNSKSDKSISRGKQNKSAVLIQIPKQPTKVREDELREALRKKKEHREKLKVKNW